MTSLTSVFCMPQPCTFTIIAYSHVLTITTVGMISINVCQQHLFYSDHGHILFLQLFLTYIY